MADINKKKYEKLLLNAKKRAKQTDDKQLTKNKHPQTDFFIADLVETGSYKDDILSMEHPLFALRAGDTTDRFYEHNGVSISVKPTSAGLATIHDKDIWIYCISKLMEAINQGEEPNRTVRFTIYDYLITTNRGTSGQYYENAKNALDRLKGTTLKMEWDTKTHRVAKGIGLIESWEIIEEKDGRMIRVEVTLPNWLYENILSTNVLTISPDYFRLRKPLDRRIYELARKHCGSQKEFTITLETLLKKSGASTSLREFRRVIRSLVKSDALPDYLISFNEKKDQVIFTNRGFGGGN